MTQIDHIDFSKYKDFETQIFYTISPLIESYNIQWNYFDFLLIAQILMTNLLYYMQKYELTIVNTINKTLAI